MRLIDADKIVDDLTAAVDKADTLFEHSENIVDLFTAFIGYINGIPTYPLTVPAKPLSFYDDTAAPNFEGRCPVCNAAVSGFDDYCCKCGQRLLWNFEKINTPKTK